MSDRAPQFYLGDFCDLGPYGNDGWMLVTGGAKRSTRAFVNGMPVWEAASESCLFLRGASSPNGAIAAIGQGHTTGHATLVLGPPGTDSLAVKDLGATSGVQPVEIRWSLAMKAFVILIVRSKYGYEALTVGEDGNVLVSGRRFQIPLHEGSSQGILDDGVVPTQWADDPRHRHWRIDGEIAGVLPNMAGTVGVAQHPQDPPRLVALDTTTDARELVYSGEAYEPHIMAMEGGVRICARTPYGAMVMEIASPIVNTLPMSAPVAEIDLPGGFDPLPYIVPAPRFKTKLVENGDPWTIEQRGARIYWEKYGVTPRVGEVWQVLDDRIEHLFDYQGAVSGYSFTDRGWLRRPTAPGQIWTNPDNWLNRYDHKTGKIVGRHRLPYRTEMRWRRAHVDAGGELGLVEAIMWTYVLSPAHEERFFGGIQETSRESIGIWAFELWDPQAQKLIDRRIANRIGTEHLPIGEFALPPDHVPPTRGDVASLPESSPFGLNTFTLDLLKARDWYVANVMGAFGQWPDAIEALNDVLMIYGRQYRHDRQLTHEAALTWLYGDLFHRRHGAYPPTDPRR